ncbi:MAG: tripartite tricarboxylate transporter substrate binding protein [Clostridia bacterium]|nr:tripartite tricarboxylate transporter substrate binding protein [Clostridia bacterium]
MKKFLAALLAAIMALSLTIVAGAEVEWPTSAITLVVPAKAGGGTDVYARITAEYFEKTTGQPLVIMNMADGAGSVGYEAVRNAKPDGLTLMWYHPSLFVSYYTHTYNYSPIENFTPIVTMSKNSGNCIVVPASSPYQTLDDLVNAAKEKPGKLIAGIQTGSQAQFLIELLQLDGECKFKTVDAGTDAERVTAILGGQLDVTVFSPANASTYEESGDVRVLCISGEERSPFFPDWPTAKEQGYEQVVYTSHQVIYGPLGMDPEMVEKINQVFSGIMDDETANEKINAVGCVFQCYDVAGSEEVVAGQDSTMKTLSELLGY